MVARAKRTCLQAYLNEDGSVELDIRKAAQKYIDHWSKVFEARECSVEGLDDFLRKFAKRCTDIETWTIDFSALCTLMLEIRT